MNAEELIEKCITAKVTKGMLNAFKKQEAKAKCQECGMVVPKYSGRYPKQCPACGADLDYGNK